MVKTVNTLHLKSPKPQTLGALKHLYTCAVQLINGLVYICIVNCLVLTTFIVVTCTYNGLGYGLPLESLTLDRRQHAGHNTEYTEHASGDSHATTFEHSTYIYMHACAHLLA